MRWKGELYLSTANTLLAIKQLITLLSCPTCQLQIGCEHEEIEIESPIRTIPAEGVVVKLHGTRPTSVSRESYSRVKGGKGRKVLQTGQLVDLKVVLQSIPDVDLFSKTVVHTELQKMIGSRYRMPEVTEEHSEVQ